jgi:riboflavin kinase / FMN adenylyltransferase
MIALLKQLEKDFGYRVFEIPAQLVEEAAVSSTKIRNALQDGRVDEAAQMIGRNYTISGKVIEGNKLGRSIGYPTANIQPSDFDQLIPANGVYAVRVKWKDHVHNAMLNIGYRPTVTEDKKLSIETHVFDFSETIYGESLEVMFTAKLRDEEKFSSMDALKEQLKTDKLNALKVLSEKN